MSDSPIPLTLLLLILIQLNAISSVLHDRSVMLPLSISNLKTTASSSPRRFLTQLPNAPMRLFDDLLINGYYTTRLLIGTPPQKFALIVDTGSTVTYVPCSTCQHCGNHQDPKFQPDSSSTYQPVKCNIDCDCDDAKESCVYERQYAEMSSSSGVLGEDVVSFGNESHLTPQRAVFGCENLETGDLYSQRADGIMGLGRGDLSIVDQLVEKYEISDSFSLCYGGMDVGGGAMILGGLSPPSGIVFTHSDPDRSPYYNIELKGMHVAGKPLPLNPLVFDGKHGTVLDSGTTFAYLPEAAFVEFKSALMKEVKSLKQIRGPDPNYNDICFVGAGSDVSQLSNSFPTVDMVFGNGKKLSLSPENYLFRHSKVHGAYCLGVFQNGKDPTTLLGGIVVRNTLVVYDRENLTIGFWKTNCSDLWERLHITGASPPPAPANDKNFTSEEPATPPSDRQPYVIPEGLQIGQITFEMSLNVSYSDLRLQITELTKFIAQDLGISSSQVNILYFTSKGKESLVRWAIFPPEPAREISNATAISLIAHVAEHRMSLPDKFGTYHLVGWKIEPPNQQQYMLLVLAVGATLIIGVSGGGIWLIWKRRQKEANAYKPVNAAVPEQELQPL